MWGARKNKISNIIATTLAESHSGDEWSGVERRGAGGRGLAPSPTARIIPRALFFLRYVVLCSELWEGAVSVASNVRSGLRSDRCIISNPVKSV